ncbi:SEC-C metal-binding domain-containing protein [Alkalicoccus luteus]|uniref:SEC-C motif-containing protein n=1 Tax=Alkalicoccus luteus TaxID=1237094 RepID=A0A969PU10_9BACI|nr:SEC-C metal-binding domain-containing protein [Alkalicoccus luteus]NJP38371.1 hypothetical protein [Alkalicoccus luteus]
MATLKRNDPCPCGSGKKYKKCCLKKLETKSKFDMADMRAFNELLPKLFDFSKKFDEQIKAEYDRKTAAFESLAVPDARAFSQLLFHWMLFNWKLEEKTILERFVDEHHDGYTPAFQEFLETWQKLEPSFFEVVHADSEYIALKNCWSEKSQTIQKTPSSQTIESGSYVIGYLYPTPDGPALGSDAVELPAQLAEAFLTECRRIDISKQKHFTKQFDQLLQLLGAVLETGPVFDKQEAYETILSELSARKRVRAASASILRRFLYQKAPRITKPAAYAASLHYWAARELPDEEAVSQQTCAEQYGVSKSTISAKVKQLSAFEQS